MTHLKLIITFLTALMILPLSGCEKGLNELELAEQYIEIPQDAQEISTHYVGEGQARFMYVTFQLPSIALDSFVNTLCLGNDELESDYTFNLESSLYEKPSWFTPEWERVKGGECVEKNVGYTIVIEEDSQQSKVFILLAW